MIQPPAANGKQTAPDDAEINALLSIASHADREQWQPLPDVDGWESPLANADATASPLAGDGDGFAANMQAVGADAYLIEQRQRDALARYFGEGVRMARGNSNLDRLKRYAAEAYPLGETKPQPATHNIRALTEKYPHLRPYVVEHFIREGETAGIHAATKAGKSWTAYGVALSVASGYHWLGRFATQQGPALIVDDELHPENLASRIPWTAKAMNLQPEDYQDNLDVMPLRGDLRDVHSLTDTFARLDRRYKLIIVDALYRILPAGISENDNAAMAQVFNSIDRYAADTGAAFILVHHASKGSQVDKQVVDIGSGAGSISRAVDAHIVLRPHEEPNHVVLDAALRSWEPLTPMVLRWEFPVWRIADHMDPAELKGRKNRTEERRAEEDRTSRQAILDALQDGPMTRRKIRTATGLGKSRAERLLDIMESTGEIVSEEITIRGQSTVEYSLGSLGT